MRIREEVPQAKVPGVCRESRPRQTLKNDGRSSENLVPKPAHKVEVSFISNHHFSLPLFIVLNSF